MNNNSSTRKFPSAKRRTHSRIDRRHRTKRIILITVIILIAALLLGAIGYIIADLAGAFPDDTTQAPDDTSSPITDTASHPSTNAYDGNSETYYLSASKQTAGVYFTVSFTNEVSVSSIEIVSSNPDYYIRRASVALSTDNKNWTAVGECSGTDASSITLSEPLYASHLRIMISESADVLFAINEITVKDSFGTAATIRGAMAGQTIGGVPDDSDTTTKAPDDETTAPPSGYTNASVSNSSLNIGDLILVNSQYDYKFLHDPASILELYNEVASNNIASLYQMGGTQLNATAMRALFDMCNAILADTGYRNILIGDGYRSREVQEDLYSRYPTTAAVPGYSEHHTALGVDLKIWDNEKGVTYTLDESYAACAPIRNWIAENAYKYGFVRRFSPDKDAITGISSDRWHYRYVGYPHAYYMSTNNLCLEEYLALLENAYQHGSRHLDINDGSGGVYEVYFVPASAGATTSVPVPVSGNYTISGNNYSGYIVTVKLS